MCAITHNYAMTHKCFTQTRLAVERGGPSYRKTPLVSQWVVQALRLEWVLSGVGISKSGGSTGKAIHAIIFFSLTQVLQFF